MSTLTTLIQLAILQHLMDSGADGLDLTILRDAWHRGWQRAAEVWGAQLPALQRMHFQTDGAFPCSRQLATAIDLLVVSGTLVPSGDHYHVRRLEDSEECLLQERAAMTEIQQQALSELAAQTVGQLTAQQWRAA